MSNTHLSYAKAKGYYFQFYSVINNDTVEFPAFITNLQDTFASNWDSQNVFGRQDPIITFRNTQRTINVGFDVPAASQNEARDNLTNLNRLIQFLYPAYQTSGTATSISASPLFKIKFANLIYDANSGEPDGSAQDVGLICGISNFQHNFFFNENANWVDRENLLIPMKFSVTFQAAILHTHDLGKISEEADFGSVDDSLTNFPYKSPADFRSRIQIEQSIKEVIAGTDFRAAGDAIAALLDNAPQTAEPTRRERRQQRREQRRANTDVSGITGGDQ